MYPETLHKYFNAEDLNSKSSVRNSILELIADQFFVYVGSREKAETLLEDANKLRDNKSLYTLFSLDSSVEYREAALIAIESAYCLGSSLSQSVNIVGNLIADRLTVFAKEYLEDQEVKEDGTNE